MRHVIHPALTATSMEGLLSGDIDAVQVPGFYPVDACAEICERISTSHLTGKYHNAPKIARIGTAFFETQASEIVRGDYAANAVRWISEMRRAVAPFQPPVDLLRLLLDEIWSAGATLATMPDGRAFCGLVRVFMPGIEAEPHMDVLAWDMAEPNSTCDVTAQLAANVYLKLPQAGGDLVIWPSSLTKEEYEAKQTEGSYGIHRRHLPNECLHITPATGDLVLFNSHLVHMVEAGFGGERISASCFVGVEKGTGRLLCWS